jgi:hypothetical protein
MLVTCKAKCTVAGGCVGAAAPPLTKDAPHTADHPHHQTNQQTGNHKLPVPQTLMLTHPAGSRQLQMQMHSAMGYHDL